mmetsp:Transcript_36139/g.66281  ORF Transcript_36139/g.66281 Transcript_36139/m.66281 type:complete len:86 (-) Transcript_36139:69-326(-)
MHEYGDFDFCDSSWWCQSCDDAARTRRWIWYNNMHPFKRKKPPANNRGTSDSSKLMRVDSMFGLHCYRPNPCTYFGLKWSMRREP